MFYPGQRTRLSILPPHGQREFTDLLDDFLHLIRAQRSQVVGAVARADLPPEADRDPRNAGLVLRAVHGTRRQHVIFSVIVFADTHVADLVPVIDLHRDGHELADDGRSHGAQAARRISVCAEGDGIVRADIIDRCPGLFHGQRKFFLITRPEIPVRLAGHAPAVLRQLLDREAVRRFIIIRKDRTGSRMRRRQIDADVLAAVILCRDGRAARDRRSDGRIARPEPADILDHDDDKEVIVLVVAVMQMELDPVAVKFRCIKDILPGSVSLRDHARTVYRVCRVSIDHIKGLLQARQRASCSFIFVQAEADPIAVHHAKILRALPVLCSTVIYSDDPAGTIPIRQCGGQEAQQQDEAQQ